MNNDEIMRREMQLLTSTEEGRKKVENANGKGTKQSFALYDYLVFKGRVRDEEAALNEEGDLYGKNLYRYQQLQENKKALEEAEEELFSEPSTFNRVTSELGTRVTTDPFAKAGQIAADVIQNEQDKEEVKWREFEGFFDKNREQRNYYNTFDPTRPPPGFNEKWNR